MTSRFSLTALLLLGGMLSASVAEAVVVRMDTVWGTTEGSIDIWVRDDLPWQTFTADSAHSAANPAQNFLAYVTSGRYTNTFIHRSFAGTVSAVQGGTFTWDASDPAKQIYKTILTDLPIFYQSSPELPNDRGTIALARTGDPDSAAAGWFFNVTDNSSVYADQTTCDRSVSTTLLACGYSTFGQVLRGMTLVDEINTIPTQNLNGAVTDGPFATMPVIDYTTGSPIKEENLVRIKTVSVISSVAPVQGASGNYTSLSNPEPSTATISSFAANVNPPGNMPDTVLFDEGVFDISLANVAVGGTVSTVLNLPDEQAANTFYKYNAGATQWEEFMWDGETGALISPDGNTVKLVFVDGGRGDDDGSPTNGAIQSSGAPGNNLNIGFSSFAVGTSGNPTAIRSPDSGLTLNDFSATADPSPTDGPAAVDASFSEGFFNIDVDTAVPGDNTEVVLTLPKAAAANVFYKYGPTPDNHAPHWYQFMRDVAVGGPGAEFVSPNVVTLTLVDGELGDDDLLADGTIIGVGGAGYAARFVGTVYRATADAVGPSTNTTSLRTGDNEPVLKTFTATASPSAGDAPAGIAFGQDFYNIALDNLITGGSTRVALTLPAGQQPNTFYKYGPTADNLTPHWYEFMWDGQTGAIFDPAGTLWLVFVDGQRGDDDLTADGKVASVGAPASNLSLGVVTSLVGASGAYITLRVNTAGAVLDSFTSEEIPSDGLSDQVVYPENAFNIALSNVPAGTPVSVTLTLPKGTRPNTYYKHGPIPDSPTTPQWYEFMWDGETGAVMSPGGNAVTLVFIDGNRGDDDLTQDGKIAGLGAPAIYSGVGFTSSIVRTDGNFTTIRTGNNELVLETFSSAANPSPSDAPAGVTFSEGFIEIKFSNVLSNMETSSEPGNANVIFTLPQGQRPNSYYKYGPTPDDHTPHWYEFMWDGRTGAVIGQNQNTIALVFIDGERGDDDLTVNQQILDVGAPAVKPASGGGGGGATDVWALLIGLLAISRRVRVTRLKLRKL